jgi:hypothetical protein
LIVAQYDWIGKPLPSFYRPQVVLIGEWQMDVPM